MARARKVDDTQQGDEKHKNYFQEPRGSRIPGAQGLRDPIGYYGSRQSDDPAVRIAEQRFKSPYGHYNPDRRYLSGESPDWPVSGDDFAGKGARDYTRSDERIQDDVKYGLAGDREIDERDIQVQVKGGIVTLTGTADSRRTKRLAEDLALSVPGVSDVLNRLRIRRNTM